MRAEKLVGLIVSTSLALSPVAYSQSNVKVLPAGTKIYLVTDKDVSSARGESDVGTIVPCKVWRDVELEGVIYIKSGTLAGCRVDKVSRRNMGGKEGKVSIGAIETKSIDGQAILLQGGYNKEGSGHKAVVWTVGLLLLWPVLFVPGGNAELPPGTVFDADTVNDLHMNASVRPSGEPLHLNLAGLAGGFTAEILLDEFLAQAKPDHLKIKLVTESPMPQKFVIDSVNGKPIDPINVKLSDQADAEGSVSEVGEVGIKPLAKHFQKGINRFDVSYLDGETRKAQEVILDIQM
jgi:hypothetical protein